MIAHIFSLVSMNPNLCNRLMIGVIRDFWTFSEISKKRLTFPEKCIGFQSGLHKDLIPGGGRMISPEELEKERGPTVKGSKTVRAFFILFATANFRYR